jgi:hypothetical protein
MIPTIEEVVSKIIHVLRYDRKSLSKFLKGLRIFREISQNTLVHIWQEI